MFKLSKFFCISYVHFCHIGDPQSIQGQCGGYPGRCYPTVNGMEGLIVNVVPTHTCAHE